MQVSKSYFAVENHDTHVEVVMLHGRRAVQLGQWRLDSVNTDNIT